MSFPFINKTLWLSNLKTRTVMNEKISVFVIWVEAIIYFLLDNMHDFTFKHFNIAFIHCSQKIILSLMKDSQKANKKGSLKSFHCVIRRFFWSVFSCPRSEYGKIQEYRKIRTRKNSIFGHFWRSLFFKS